VYKRQVLEELMNPAVNITIFIPDSAEIWSYLNSIDPGLSLGDESVSAFLILSSILDGGYCPQDLIGKVINTKSGVELGEEYQLQFNPVDEDTRKGDVVVTPLFGTQPDEYVAKYVGAACFSQVYTLDKSITPWEDLRDDIPSIGIQPFPVTDQQSLYGANATCIREVTTTGNDSTMITVLMDESTSTLSGGAIAGILVGAIAATAIASYVIFCLISKRNAKKRQLKRSKSPSITSNEVNQDDLDETNTEHLFTRQLSAELSNVEGLILRHEDLKFEIDTLTNRRIRLGKGRFGVVYKAIAFGTEPVAVKCIEGESIMTRDDGVSMIRSNSAPLNVRLSKEADSLEKSKNTSPNESILKEVAVLKACRSHYVVTFLGACFVDTHVMLVTELMPAGDLWKALRANKLSWYTGYVFCLYTFIFIHSFASCTELGYQRVTGLPCRGLEVALDTAAGLTYLHGRRIIHLDLKSSNILLRWNGRNTQNNMNSSSNSNNSTPNDSSVPTSEAPFEAKVGDVGLSRMLPVSHEYLADYRGGGTWNWCAPEIILSEKVTQAADMWSFGVVLWEICTGEVPVRGQMREVEVPRECPQEVADLIRRCHKVDPALRPTAPEALSILRSLHHQRAHH